MNSVNGKRVRDLIGLVVLLFSIVTLLLSCSKPPTGGDSNNLIGTWNLTTVNGQPIEEGVYLRWSFTTETVTAISDMDCVEVIRYNSSGGTLKILSVVSREGSECGDDDSESEL